MATHKNALADLNGVRPAKCTRRLGILALGTLLGNGPPSLPAADGPHASALSWPGFPSAEAATTATSSLALLPPPELAAPAVTFTVTTAADLVDPGDGKLSLREAVGRANATAALDAIEFAAALEGRTLVLTGGELTVTQDLIVDGDRNDDGSEVTLSGGDASRVLTIVGGATDVALRDLGLTHGRVVNADGGAILLGGGHLTLTGCLVHGNSTYSREGEGGGVFAASGSRLAVIGSVISGNAGANYGHGGGISAAGDVELVIRNSQVTGNRAGGGGPSGSGGGIRLDEGSSLLMEDSRVSGNHGGGEYSFGGGLALFDSTVAIIRSTISANAAGTGGGIGAFGGSLGIFESTLAENGGAGGDGHHRGGALASNNGVTTIRNTTITGNAVFSEFAPASGGGIFANSSSRLDIDNSIVAGNVARSRYGVTYAPDVDGTITRSNGHNVFGSDVAGSIPGDRESVAPAAIFAALDPDTGGGQLSPTGIVPLKSSVTNPAVSAADPLAAGRFGQLGTTPRPRPAGSLPDIGAVEVGQPLSTGATPNNDVITGSAAANVLRGLAGNDLIRALQGNDTVGGDAGSDFLDGGLGNNRLEGGSGVDLVTFAFSAVPVVVALGGTGLGFARRDGESDGLVSIEGAIGTTKADRFTGDERDNRFQGGLGRDLATGGAGRDTYDYDRVQESPPGTSERDVISDFAPNQDVLDLTRIDADPTAPGDQAFRWVGTAPLTGVGQLGYVLSGGNTIVRASTDADPAPELAIQLTGRRTLTEGDVRL